MTRRAVLPELHDQVANLIDAALDDQFGHCLTQRDVARQLCVSTRTLKRRLRKCGTGYRQLVDEVRRRRVLRLLGEPPVSLDVIADSVGYSSGANLSRAFRRWAGVSPRQFRLGADGQRA